MEYIVSNIIYLSVFFLSLFIFRQAENKLYVDEQFYSKTEKEHGKHKMSKYKFKFIFFSVLGIFIISFFAGIRANDVGVDTSGYPIKFMNIAVQSTSFTEFVQYCPELKNEPLGAILVYFCSYFTEDSGLLLFFYQFFTVLPIFLAVKKFKKYISITDAMAVYLFMFFNNSLNMMRQSVSCAFILLGFSELLTNNKISKKSIIVFICAILFHRSAIYGVALLLAFYYIYKIKIINFKKVIYVFIILLPLFLEILANILVKYITDPQLLYYIDIFIYKDINQDWFVNPFSIYSIVYLIVFGGMLLIPYIIKILASKNKIYEIEEKQSEYSAIFKSFNFVGFLIYVMILFSMKTMYGIRFSIFFDYIYMLSIPLYIANKKGNRIFVYIILLVFWEMLIIRMGWSGSEIYNWRF